MNSSLYYDKVAIRCCLCRMDFEWNGSGNAIKKHVAGKPHVEELHRESITQKRARSVAVKGLELLTKYFKPITKVFGGYAAIESTLRIHLGNNKSIIVVRFFSPETAQKLLSFQSAWNVDGIYAEVVPDIYSSEFYSKPKKFREDGPDYIPSPPKIEDKEWFQRYSWRAPPKVQSPPSQVSPQGLRDPSEMNHNSYSNSTPLRNPQFRTDYSPQDEKNSIANEYRKISFYGNEEPKASSSQSYASVNAQHYSGARSSSPNPSHRNAYQSQNNNPSRSTSDVYQASSLDGPKLSQSFTQPSRSMYPDKNSSWSHGDEYKEHGSTSQQPNSEDEPKLPAVWNRDRDLHSERYCFQKPKQKKRDRSRSPRERCSTLAEPNNKRILPKVRVSLLVGSFTKQVQELLTEVNSDVCKPFKVSDICNDVHTAVDRVYQGTIVKPYGSLNVGIGIKGGVLELCVYLPDDIKLQLLQKKFLCIQYLKTIRDILKREGSLFRDVGLNRNNTAVEFVHNSSGYSVKVGILRDAMVLNDRLMDIFISSDERLVPVFVFLLFWAHSQGVLDGASFDEPEMVLLIIFYLQRLEKPILPPAHMLQDDNGGRDINNKCLSYWHSTFIVDADTFPSNENDSDILTLIQGFFLFYSDFAFKNTVLSIFSGLTIPSNVFQLNTNLPAEFKRYLYLVQNRYVYALNTDSPMCVQDPIKLNRNATSTVTAKQLDYFREKCLSAMGMMYKFKIKHSSEEGLACALLNLTKNTVDHVHKVRTAICTRYEGRLNEEDTVLVFERLTNLLGEVLANILKAKFTANKYVNYSKKKNLIDPQVVYLCAQFYNLWSTRGVYKDQVPHCSSTLEWEAAVSDKLIDSVYRRVHTPKVPIFEFLLKGHVLRKEKLAQVDIIFKDVQEDFVEEFVRFFAPIVEYESKRICIV